MERHLTDLELASFRDGTANALDLLRMDEHVIGCGECRSRILALREPCQAIRAIATDFAEHHLTDGEFVDYASQRPLPADVMRHLDWCAQCRFDAADLRRFSAQPPTSLRAILAMAAAVILVSGLSFWVAKNRPIASPLPEIAELRVPEAVRSMPGPLHLRSGLHDKAGSFHTLSPVGTAIIGDQPQLVWTQAAPGATYTVHIYDDQFHEIQHSEPLNSLSWAAPALPRGASYRWEVMAESAGRKWTAPAPPDPEARFLVVTAAEAQKVEAARATDGRNPLTLGVIYANAGALEEARKAFEAAPNSALKDRYLKELDRE